MHHPGGYSSHRYRTVHRKRNYFHEDTHSSGTNYIQLLLTELFEKKKKENKGRTKRDKLLEKGKEVGVSVYKYNLTLVHALVH